MNNNLGVFGIAIIIATLLANLAVFALIIRPNPAWLLFVLGGGALTAYVIAGAAFLSYGQGAKVTDIITSFSTLGLVVVGVPATLVTIKQLRHPNTEEVEKLKKRLDQLERRVGRDAPQGGQK